MILVLIFKAGNSLGESASNAVGSLRQRSWLDRTATRRKKRERVFEMLGLPERFTWGKDRDIIIL